MAVQETHLTGQGFGRFKKELAWQKSGFQMTHGAPAPPKNQSIKTLGGKQTGVAFLSHHALRSLAHHWSSEDYATGRCLATAAFVQKRWITMGTVYGFSEGSHSIEVQQHTDRMLAGLSSRIVEAAHGLRMIGGDWNLDRSCIPQVDQWENKGWVEAQHLAYLKWQRPCQPTCKKKTIKDYLFLSPEFLPYVQDIQLDSTTFADHAAILVTVSDLDRPPLVPLWRKPKPIIWPPKVNHADWETTVQHLDDSDEWYQSLWHDVESFANQQCKQQQTPIPQQHQLGRGNTKDTTWSDKTIAPVKPNRRGDIQSEFAGANLTHSRWTKQIRRLQHFTRCTGDTEVNASMMEHRASLWRKIRQAPGFHQGFPVWWAMQVKIFPNTPALLPVTLPDLDMANAIFLEFSKHERTLEQSLQKARIIHAVQRRSQDPLLTYKDIQRDRAEPVQTVIQTTKVPVLSVEPTGDAVSIRLAQPLPDSIQTIPIKGFQLHSNNLSQTTSVCLRKLHSKSQKT